MIRAFVLINVETGEHLNFAKSAKEEMMKIEGVTEVYGVFCRFDIIAQIEAPNLEALSRIITNKMRAIPGVSSTESLIIGF